MKAMIYKYLIVSLIITLLIGCSIEKEHRFFAVIAEHNRGDDFALSKEFGTLSGPVHTIEEMIDNEIDVLNKIKEDGFEPRDVSPKSRLSFSVYNQKEPDTIRLFLLDGENFHPLQMHEKKFILPEEEGIYVYQVRAKWGKRVESYLFAIDVRDTPHGEVVIENILDENLILVQGPVPENKASNTIQFAITGVMSNEAKLEITNNTLILNSNGMELNFKNLEEGDRILVWTIPQRPTEVNYDEIPQLKATKIIKQ